MNGGLSSTDKSIYHLGDTAFEPGPAISTDYTSAFVNTSTPIVLDNGSARFRAGWGSEFAQGPRIDVDNIVAKYKDRKTNRNIALAGAQIYGDTLSKQTAKAPFEGDIVCNFDAMETMLDYAFTTLGIDGNEAIPHPVAMSEIVCNPASSRARTCSISAILASPHWKPSQSCRNYSSKATIFQHWLMQTMQSLLFTMRD